MKRIWTRAAAAAALCAVLLGGCAFAGEIASDRAPADPLTGQELQYPGQRTAAAVIDNTGTVQWGIGSASVVLEAQTEVDAPTSLSLVYPAVDAMPRVGPVTLGCSAASRSSRSSVAAGSLTAAIWTITISGRWMRWKWGAMLFPVTAAGAMPRSGAPAERMCKAY